MPNYYDKNELKNQLEIEHIYDLLEAWGGEPAYSKDGIVAQTICHNAPGDGSRKLYYYEGTKLFVCYTSCIGSFDIFDLCIKVAKIQRNKAWELYDAMNYIAKYFGFNGISADVENHILEDWKVFQRHEFTLHHDLKKIQLDSYDPIILSRFHYPRIEAWEKEGISREVCKKNLIGFYPGGGQITIPHFDIYDRLIGIRGRTIDEDEAERYGKYRPLKVNRQLYNHPLSMNLYNLNKSKDNIKQVKTAIIFESEKACMLYQTIYGQDNDISVACCGSSISAYHIELLKSLGVNEIIVAFDRQFQEIGDNEFKQLKAKLIHLYQKYSSIMNVTTIFDKHMITSYKASPIDEGKEKFEQLLKERLYNYGN